MDEGLRVHIHKYGTVGLQNWRKKHPNAVLSLEGADFSGLDLSDADFSGARIQQANFSNCGLRRARFTSAEAPQANFGNADLAGARFDKVGLASANFEGADVESADFSSASLHESSISKARNLLKANLAGANLSRVDFSGVNLKGMTLKNQALEGAKLSNTDLTGANLIKAVLVDCDLSGAILKHANMESAFLRNANLSNADLTGSRLAFAELKDTNFNGARIPKADFKEAKISAAQFRAVLGARDAVNLNTTTIQQDSRYFEEVVRPWIDRAVSWEQLRSFGKLPLFGASYAMLISIPALLYVHAIYNNKAALLLDWAHQKIETESGARIFAWSVQKYIKALPVPEFSLCLLGSTLMLAAAATIYAFFCPQRIKEFSSEQWRYALRRDLMHYWPDSWKYPLLRTICGVFYVAGALGVLRVLLTKLYDAALYIVSSAQ